MVQELTGVPVLLRLASGSYLSRLDLFWSRRPDLNG